MRLSRLAAGLFACLARALGCAAARAEALGGAGWREALTTGTVP